VRALPDGLAGLVPHMGSAGCIHGRRWDFDGKPFFWQCRFSERLAMPVPVPGNVFEQGPEFETNVGVFEGMLVAREVVDRIGFPDARFFITWDDAVYGWLASQVARVLYVDHYALERRRRQRQVDLGIRHLNDASDLYRYHTMRNRPLVKAYVQRAGVYSPIWFAIGSALIVCKEAMRLLVVQHEVRGFAALWRGWRASRCEAPRAAVPARAMGEVA
jgi:rhamnopyranosyl-N-acetylglucosaminyl-diphospho-decaprenol beta-1,3/1,4-galactofuranosyltransferase